MERCIPPAAGDSFLWLWFWKDVLRIGFVLGVLQMGYGSWLEDVVRVLVAKRLGSRRSF